MRPKSAPQPSQASGLSDCVNALGDAKAGGEEQAGERIFPDAAGGEVDGEGIKSPDPGRNLCAARAQRVFRAEVNGDASEGAEQAVESEDNKSRGKRVDAEEPEDDGEESGIERRLQRGGPAPGEVRRTVPVAAGQRTRNPAHLPAELLVEFICVGQIAISKEDHNHANGKRRKNNCGKQPERNLFLLRA